jgi:hypothetical protein
MDATEALIIFLNKALIIKKDRLIGFLTKQKNHDKFLNTIYHELEHYLNPSLKVSAFPEKVLRSKGYLYEPQSTIGETINSLQEIVDSSMDSFLVISQDGNYAIHGPETLIDSRAYYVIK